MRRTGLPYDMSQMDDIKNNGAIVDMSDIKFPGIPVEKIPRTAFIFFRNTGFDVKLDFSKCSFEQKELFLTDYLVYNIDVKLSEFATSYVKILNRFIGNDIDVECILTNEEIDLFIENHNKDIHTLLQFFMSLPIFTMFYFSLNGEGYSLDDIEKTDQDFINDNLYHIIETDGFVVLYDNELEIQPLFYEKLFTFDNPKLLQAVEKLPFFSILHGLCTKDPAEWESMLRDSNQLILTDQKE
jgi:hypothetical protein